MYKRSRQDLFDEWVWIIYEGLKSDAEEFFKSKTTEDTFGALIMRRGNYCIKALQILVENRRYKYIAPFNDLLEMGFIKLRTILLTCYFLEDTDISHAHVSVMDELNRLREELYSLKQDEHKQRVIQEYVDLSYERLERFGYFPMPFNRRRTRPDRSFKAVK